MYHMTTTKLTLNELLNKLPPELINLIVSYSYNVQNKTLLNDIIHFNLTKDIIHSHYFNFNLHQDMDIDYKQSLMNDIFHYANDNKSIDYGLTDKFCNIFFRNKQLKNKKNISNYVCNKNKTIIYHINIFWGIFNVNERMEFINKYCM